jgi:pimeloyl-ACP methyl ester carboxylesterase
VAKPSSHSFEANGVRLVVHDWGGEGPPVLLAHPTGFHGLVWEEITEQLVGDGCRVWSFDFRGHGDSEAPEVDDDGYSWHGFGDDVLAVTRHLGLAGRADLLAAGHSKGGAALLLAEAQAPGTYARVWAYEPIVFESEVPLEPQDDFFLARSARKRRNVWSSPDEAYKSYASKPPLNVMTPRSLRAYVDYGLRETSDGTFELKCRPEVEARVYAMGPNHGAWNVLPNIGASVLVACGERSNSIDAALAARIASRLPRGRVEVFAGLGHFGPQEDPLACAKSMNAFRTS